MSYTDIDFAFVANHIDIKEVLPIEFLPGYTFEKANSGQITRIKTFLEKTVPSFVERGNLYESIICAAEFGGYRPIPQRFTDSWKYYVVSCKEWKGDISGLQYAANISEAELQFAVRFVKNGHIHDPIAFFNYMHELGNPSPQPEVIDKEQLIEIGLIYKQIKQTETQYPDIKRAVSMFDDLKSLPMRSDFYVFGLFAIIELLLTHKPGNKETGDSLTHQVKTKIPLINKRLAKPVDIMSFFGDVKDDKIWTKLYEYRSHIAHGGRISFKSDFKLLKDIKTVRSFVRSVTKSLLRHSLTEPQLFMDLKLC